MFDTTVYATLLKENDIVYLNAESNSSYNDIAIYNGSGNNVGYLQVYEKVTSVLNQYNNIEQIGLVVAPSKIENFENYQTLE